MTAALYVDVDRGPYVDLLGRDSCWGVDRDAKTYAGPGPVVAHPPCGPWGMLRGLCRTQDRDAAPFAVAQVRRWGGVLEHPAGSALWKHCGLPAPFRRVPAFVGREWALQVEQVRWGHPARKRTWLLFVDVAPRDLGPLPPPRRPTHCIGGSRKPGARGFTGLRVMAGRETHVSPRAFADWLVSAVSTSDLGHTRDTRDT